MRADSHRQYLWLASLVAVADDHFVSGGDVARWHSQDGNWFWSGVAWVPAWSPDHRWWWNGAAWVRSSRLNPPWRTADTIKVVVWLIAVPIALSTVPASLALVAHSAPITVFWVSVGLLPVWAAVGGMIIRPTGGWWEPVLLGVALTIFLAVIDVAAFMVSSAAGNAQVGDDDGVAVGLAMLAILTPVPFAAMALVGRALRRVCSRRLVRLRRGTRHGSG